MPQCAGVFLRDCVDIGTVRVPPEDGGAPAAANASSTTAATAPAAANASSTTAATATAAAAAGEYKLRLHYVKNTEYTSPPPQRGAPQ